MTARRTGAPAEATPYAAWQGLLGSPWENEFDLRTFLATRKDLIDHDSRFEAIALAVDDVRVDGRLAEWGFAPPK